MSEIEKAREALAMQMYWTDLGEFSQAEAEADAIISVARAIAREEIEAAKGTYLTRDEQRSMGDALRLSGSKIATINQEGGGTRVAVPPSPRRSRPMKTRDRLATELRKVADATSPANAAKYEAFAERAATGEFDDFGDMYVCPITQLYTELMQAGFSKFAARVANGEFDATKEESDEWARSPSGQAAAKLLTPEMRKLLGMDLAN